MKLLILNLVMTILLCYAGYNLFHLYAVALNAIVMPNCPETKCVCERQPCKCAEGLENCNYLAVCNDLGYCEACPETYLEEFRNCQKLLEEINKGRE